MPETDALIPILELDFYDSMHAYQILVAWFSYL